MSACAFCLNPAVQERLIYQDDLVMAFPGNMPITPGHVLVCPIRCVGKMDELTEQEWIAIKALVQRVKRSLVKTFDAEGFNCAWNEGELAGQSVNHVHLHVVPRKTGDTGIYQYEPREFLYRPGSRAVSSEQELRQVAEYLRDLFV